MSHIINMTLVESFEERKGGTEDFAASDSFVHI